MGCWTRSVGSAPSENPGRRARPLRLRPEDQRGEGSDPDILPSCRQTYLWDILGVQQLASIACPFCGSVINTANLVQSQPNISQNTSGWAEAAKGGAVLAGVAALFLWLFGDGGNGEGRARSGPKRRR